jgi:multiple sugar transport system ATP-binding protein
MATLSIEHMSKKYGSASAPAVSDLSLEADSGELIVLLGPSGCGKTTALRCIAGLEDPDGGTIKIDGRPINDLAPKDRDIALVFQSYALYPYKSVFDNIAFPLRMRKVPRDEIARRVKEFAEMLRIGHLLDRKPAQLSGGEAQRVALARAIVRQPKVFLMDEPLSNLDAKLRMYTRTEIKRLQKELKVTTIYVTHDQAEAMSMADKIAIMDHGKLQQFMPPSPIYAHPTNEFVAGFLGSPPMNLVSGTLLRQNGDVTIDLGEFRYSLPFGDVKADPLKEVIFGVRPEDIRLSKQATGSIEAEVFVIEPLGSEDIIDVRLGKEILKVKSTDFSGAVGDKVWVTFNEAKIHLFDKQTGDAIV